MQYCGLADKDELQKTVFSILYKEKKTGNVYLKRCRIEKFILGKSYSLVPDNTTILTLTTKEDVVFELKYKPKPRLKILEESFDVCDYLVKGVKAQGVRLYDERSFLGQDDQEKEKIGKPLYFPFFRNNTDKLHVTVTGVPELMVAVRWYKSVGAHGSPRFLHRRS